MSLNPLRDAMKQAGLSSFGQQSPFKATADAALAEFRAARSDLERQVRRGDLTPKIARERATAAAASLRDRLLREAEGFSASPRAFLDRLVVCAPPPRPSPPRPGPPAPTRRLAREHASPDALQRETNRLLRQLIVEQQLASRAFEFEGAAFTKSINGAAPAPTLDGLLAFHEQASQAGDDAAVEWTRRHLEAQRPLTLGEEDRRKIDLACDRPDRSNPRLVARDVEAMQGRGPAEVEEFVARSIEARDASACAAAFVLARECPEGASARWVRAVLEGLKDFPDAALAALRSWEADSRRADAEAARAAAEYAATLAESEARFPKLDAPDPEAVERMARLQAIPAARPDQPIGLTLGLRGRLESDPPAVAEPDAASPEV